MGWFRKSEEAEPLPVSMAGVKLGHRLLAVGLSDPGLIATLARKTGLTGHVAAIDADAERVQRGSAAIEKEGALVDVTRAPWGMMPYDYNSFDIAVIRDLLMTMTPDVRVRCLAEVLRVLRPGGRAIVIEAAPRGGIGGFLTRGRYDEQYDQRGGAVEALRAEGFAAVRLLGEREGVIYVEGVKRGASETTPGVSQ